jgi:hypothetical protein
VKYNDASWNLMWYWYNEIKWNIHSLQLCSSNIKETCRAMWNVFVLRVLWTPPWFWQWPLWCRRVLSPGCFVSAPDSKKTMKQFWNGRKHNSNSQQLRKLKQTEELRKQTASTCFNGLISSTVLLTKCDCKMLQDISSKILPAALLKYLARYLESTVSPSCTS